MGVDTAGLTADLTTVFEDLDPAKTAAAAAASVAQAVHDNTNASPDHVDTIAPTMSDDETLGYTIGSRWVITGSDEYVCLDASTGAAVWRNTTAGGTSLSSNTPAALGVAAAGVGIAASRDDHIHAMPSAANVGADPAGTAASAVSTHVGLADPHTQYALESALGSAAYTASTAYDAAGAAAAAQAASQPLNAANLSAIALLTSTAYGRALLELANQAALLALIPVGDASTPGLLKLGATGGAAPYERTFGYPCDDLVTVLASSGSGHFERDPHTPTLLRLKPQPFADVADAKASPPTLWPLTNSGKLTSASISGGVLTQTHDTTTSAYTAGTASSPYFSRAFRPPPVGTMEFIFRQTQTTGDVANDVVKAGISYGAGRVTAGALIFATTGGSVFTKRITLNEVVAFSLTGRSAAQAATGWWIRFSVDPISGAVVAHYSEQAPQPTTEAEWTWAASTMATGFQTSGSWLYFSTVTRTTGGSGACTGTFQPVHERVYQDTAYQTLYVPLLAAGYPTTSDTLSLIASAGVSAERWTPSITKLRLALADAMNRLPGDAATATWSCTGSDSDTTPDVATTMQAAASLDLKLDGTDTAADAAGYKYWALHVKFTSASNAQAGSLETALIRLVPA